MEHNDEWKKSIHGRLTLNCDQVWNIFQSITHICTRFYESHFFIKYIYLVLHNIIWTFFIFKNVFFKLFNTWTVLKDKLNFIELNYMCNLKFIIQVTTKARIDYL